MNKQTKIIIMGLLVVLLMGVLVGCPTESPKEKDKSGDDGGGDPIAEFTFTNEYIDFHSYYAEVTNNTGQDLTDVVLVVSTAEQPKLLTNINIDPTARVIRKFDSDILKTRKISIGWTDEFSKDKYDKVKDKTTADKNQYRLSNDASYDAVPWIIRANTEYYLHVYYDGKKFTKKFSTPDYPSDIAEAEKMFKGNMVGGLFNTGLTYSERKSTEPVAIAHINSWNVNDRVALSPVPDGSYIIGYYDGIGLVSVEGYDNIYFAFGDDADLFLHTPTAGKILDVMFFGYQNTAPNGENITGYRVYYDLSHFIRTVDIITE